MINSWKTFALKRHIWNITSHHVLNESLQTISSPGKYVQLKFFFPQEFQRSLKWFTSQILREKNSKFSKTSRRDEYYIKNAPNTEFRQKLVQQSNSLTNSERKKHKAANVRFSYPDTIFSAVSKRKVDRWPSLKSLT